jgi:hypothetical protein
MKQNARAGQSGFARLAALNPVPPSERDSLTARLDEIRPRLPQLDPSAGRAWWKPPIVALAVIVVLGVGGVAIAASWNPLAGIGSADRPAEPTDTLSPAVKEQLRVHETSWPGGISQIGSRLVDQARLLGELPDGHKVYAVPTSKGKLCILVAESARVGGESCHEPLTRAEPITWTMSKVGPAAPLVIWGATTDDVVSVSFEVGGQPVTAPVENNFYAWEGQPTVTLGSVSPATVTFSDGTTAPAP